MQTSSLSLHILQSRLRTKESLTTDRQHLRDCLRISRNLMKPWELWQEEGNTLLTIIPRGIIRIWR